MHSKLFSTTAIIPWLIKLSFQIATVKNVFLYTDASDKMFSGIITQAPLVYLRPTHKNEHHGPFCFLSGLFNAKQLAQSILEKEAFYVLGTLDQKHWISIP